MIRPLICFLALWTIAVMPHAACAEEARAEARELFLRGVALFESEDYESAAVAFHESFAANPEPIALYNYAMCQRELFRFLESIEALEQYLALGPDRIGAAEAREAQRLIAEMSAQLGTLQIVVEPRTATVSVDGVEVDSNHFSSLRLRAGPHQVEANADGHSPGSEQVMVIAQRVTEVHLALEPVEQTAPVELELTDTEPGSIELSDVPADTEPAPPLTRRRWRMWVGIIAGVVAAAGLGLGLGLGLQDDDLPEGDLRMTLP